MRSIKYFPVILTALILLTTQSQGQSAREILFKGGLDTLAKNVYKNVVALVREQPPMHLLFYEVTLDKKGFKSVRQIYAKPDSISLLVTAAIQKTAPKWIGNRRRPQKIILPVFLIPDEESKVKVRSGELKLSSKYPGANGIISNVTICPPLEIIYYESVN